MMILVKKAMKNEHFEIIAFQNEGRNIQMIKTNLMVFYKIKK